MAYKQPSSGSSFKMMGSSPAKHGTTDDFLYGKNGHNPDTMEGKHEDWHTDKIEAEKKKPSPAKQFAGSDKKDILSEVENKREHHQDKFDDWIKGSKKSTESLNKRADVLKTLKKVTKTKVPKGAK